MEQFSLESLIEKLNGIVNKWHPGTRPGNDGNQGNTLEDLLGVEENNFSIPDFGVYEIKTQKAETGSLITLFHKEPKPPKSVPKLLLAMGWKHSEAGNKYPENEMSFRMTTPSNTYTSRGFTVSIYEETINIEFDKTEVNLADSDRTNNYNNLGEWLTEIENRSPVNYKDIFPLFYDRKDFESKCIEKLDKTLFVTCKTRKKNGRKEFFFDEAFLLEGFNHDKMTELFSQGAVYIDFDARTGHNHGTKIRIKKDRLPDLFDFSRAIL